MIIIDHLYSFFICIITVQKNVYYLVDDEQIFGWKFNQMNNLFSLG
jgi:hypothetical protein